ncbi:relaxase/mobilization nuclease domain-containing protein [Escherichia coli]|nr:relaxase/mobilization nuclease domain-containing protein [Escherichia coli]
MKGMQNIKRGKCFAGVMLYALRSASHHKVAPVVIGGNMMGSFAKELIAEFDATKTLRSDVAKPVWHNSLRLPKNETLTDAQWSGIADDYMKRMGFSETHLRAYVLHDDKDGQHIHIVASRIDATSGKLYLGKNENLNSTRIIQDLEKDYQLTQTKGTDAPKPSSSPVKRKKTRNEAMQEKRTGELCPKTIIQEAIDTLLISQISEHEFVQQLAALKVKAIPNRASTGKMNGFSFEYAKISFKASQLGKKYSWKNLEPFIVMSSLPDKNESCVLNDIRENFNEAKETGKIDLSLEEHQTVIKSCLPLLNPTDILLPLPEKAVSENNNVYTGKVKPNSKSYIDITMRWLETIPFIDLIANTFKKLNNSLLKVYKKPFRIFSATFLSLEPPSLLSVEKYTQKSGFGLKN